MTITGEIWVTLDKLAKWFHGVPSSHPEVFALGLYKFDPEALKAIAEEGLRLLQRDQEKGKQGGGHEGLPFVDLLPDDF